jgi:hypothetical protein
MVTPLSYDQFFKFFDLIVCAFMSYSHLWTRAMSIARVSFA